jgi:hypothetical protein
MDAFERLERSMSQGSPTPAPGTGGAKRVSMADVAARAGVSGQTV